MMWLQKGHMYTIFIYIPCKSMITKVNFMAQNAIMNVISPAAPATTDFTSNARDPSTGFLPLEASL